MLKVSVIIPNFNGEKYIEECINSCINQGDCVKEIIVVDDNSTDNSWTIISSFLDQYPSIIKLFKNSGKGACAARNYGFTYSSGEFIQFLDADDILSTDKIEKQLHQLLASENYQKKLIHARWGRFFNGNINEVDWWGPHELIRFDLKPADWLVANHMSMTGCWLTPRELIEKGGLWNESLKKNQDGEFFSRLMMHADEVLYCDDAKVYYRSDVATSVSRNKSREAAESNLKAIELISSYLFSLETSNRAKRTIANMYQDFLYGNFISFPDLAAVAESKIYSFGGANLRLKGSRVLRVLESLLGWKKALLIKYRLQNIFK